MSCLFHWGPGRTSRVVQEFRSPGGTLVAEVESGGSSRTPPGTGWHWRNVPSSWV